MCKTFFYLALHVSEEDQRHNSLSLSFSISIFLSVFLILSSLLPPEIVQSSERAWNRCPDTSFSLMRIRNILIKTHNPPLNPSLQNHLHSAVLLHTATMTAHSGPLLYSLHLSPRAMSPFVSPWCQLYLICSHQTFRDGSENSAFVCTSVSPV